MGISGVPFQNTAPSQGMHKMYSHATGGPPFSNNALVKPSYVGPTSVPSLSPVQAYRQQHEVTATVCIFVYSGVISFYEFGNAHVVLMRQMCKNGVPWDCLLVAKKIGIVYRKMKELGRTF